MLQGCNDFGCEEIHVEHGDHDFHKGGVLQDEACVLVQRILPCGRLKGGAQAGLGQQQTILLHERKGPADGCTGLNNVIVCHVQLHHS